MQAWSSFWPGIPAGIWGAPSRGDDAGQQELHPGGPGRHPPQVPHRSGFVRHPHGSESLEIGDTWILCRVPTGKGGGTLHRCLKGEGGLLGGQYEEGSQGGQDDSSSVINKHQS